ncbi:MAG TPA: hypothetical protein VF892_25085, partial [Pseudonocardiaceae bacterium]
AAGVLLDWVVRVRPLANRVVDLETRLEASSRPARVPAATDSGSMFERGMYDPPGRFDSTGFGGDRSRGLLTPADNSSLASDLLERESAPDDAERPSVSGVEDYPGVARLSGIWADEAHDDATTSLTSATSIVPETTTTWQPDGAAGWQPAGEHAWEPDAADAADAATPTSVTPLLPPAADADEQYLEFLRNGAASKDADADTDSAEVTSVLPYPIPGEQNAEGYQAFEGYQEFSGNGYGTNGHQGDFQDSDYQIVDYQQEDLSEPAESDSPLPHRSTAELGHRYAPFEIPFGQLDNSDVQPRAGDMTPIGEGGFLPFQKPGDEAGEPTDETSWFDLTDPGPGSDVPPMEPGVTSRMLPIGQPGEEHPDLLGASVFGGDEDMTYQEEGRSRSLFEPVIAPEAIRDDFRDDFTTSQPAYENAYENTMFDATGGQGTTPRPIRVRTGMEPLPAPTPTNGTTQPLDIDAGGGPDTDTPPGPFGPGSALPLPDGSSPSTEFRVKARTSSMVFHTESSPFYERLEPQVWFRDPTDAQRAGFTSWERPRTW